MSSSPLPTPLPGDEEHDAPADDSSLDDFFGVEASPEPLPAGPLDPQQEARTVGALLAEAAAIRDAAQHAADRMRALAQVTTTGSNCRSRARVC